jgi:hypothetical protein
VRLERRSRDAALVHAGDRCDAVRECRRRVWIPLGRVRRPRRLRRLLTDALLRDQRVPHARGVRAADVRRPRYLVRPVPGRLRGNRGRNVAGHVRNLPERSDLRSRRHVHRHRMYPDPEPVRQRGLRKREQRLRRRRQVRHMRAERLLLHGRLLPVRLSLERIDLPSAEDSGARGFVSLVLSSASGLVPIGGRPAEPAR